MYTYFYRVGISLSVLLNTVLGGYSNQTFSARNWAWKKEGRWNIVWFIDAITSANHCAVCWSYWITRKGMR